jgi:hypothetical protein
MSSYTVVQAAIKISNAKPKKVEVQAMYLDMVRAFSLYTAKDDQMV